MNLPLLSSRCKCGEKRRTAKAYLREEVAPPPHAEVEPILRRVCESCGLLQHDGRQVCSSIIMQTPRQVQAEPQA